MKVSQGQLVICLKGKEKGKLMCVTEVDDKFIYLVDGKDRRFNNPKRKNPKHVEVTDKILTLPMTDKSLRKILLSEV